jgi:DNA polymerase-3 subunit delta'
LHITVPDREVAEKWLHQQLSNCDHVTALLDMANGAPLLARDYGTKNVIEVRKECFNDWIQIATKQVSPVKIAEQWQDQPGSLMIAWMTSWIIDIIKYIQDPQNHIFSNKDMAESLKLELDGLHLKSLFQFYDLLLVCKQRLLTQVNKQLMFEEILICWHQLSSDR